MQRPFLLVEPGVPWDRATSKSMHFELLYEALNPSHWTFYVSGQQGTDAASHMEDACHTQLRQSSQKSCKMNFSAHTQNGSI